MNRYKIPNIVIRRMSAYYRILGDMAAGGKTAVRSSQLGEKTHCAASQVRQDLSFFGCFGISGQGYSLAELRENIAKVMGVDRKHAAVVIGVGNIGSHLIMNQVFEQSGFALKAAFDVAPDVVGREFKGITVQNVSELEAFLKDEKISMAALCLPAKEAQAVAEILCTNGIEAIWNLTGRNLQVPWDVILEELSLSDSFLALSYQLKQRRFPEEERTSESEKKIYRLSEYDHYGHKESIYAAVRDM